jgi:hypothetical protein
MELIESHNSTLEHEAQQLGLCCSRILSAKIKMKFRITPSVFARCWWMNSGKKGRRFFVAMMSHEPDPRANLSLLF